MWLLVCYYSFVVVPPAVLFKKTHHNLIQPSSLVGLAELTVLADIQYNQDPSLTTSAVKNVLGVEANREALCHTLNTI